MEEHIPESTHPQTLVPETAPANNTSKKSIFHFALATLVVIPSLLFWLFFAGVFAIIGVAVVAEDEYACNVARIPIHGVMTTTDAGFSQLLEFGGIVSADSVIDNINTALEDESIEAILLDIDSPGGTPVSAEEIMNELQGSSKPTVTVMRDIGTSAAYWAAAGTDHIIASPISDIGSIGVTMSYLESASSTEIEGSRWVDLSSGLFKDAGNPERRLREEEEEYFQDQVDTIHGYMVERIAEAREGKISKEALASLADGRAFLGVEGVKLGLIDELGSFNEAITHIASVLSKDENEVTICPPMSGGLVDFF